MAIALLVSLLLTADPSGPIATRTPPKAVASVPVATQPSSPSADYLPEGAPADDFGFVAWCDGVLSGHMDLAERVKDVEPLDDMTQKIGHAYLRAYSRALALAPESRTAAGKARAEAARADGWAKWDQARKAPLRLAADTYLAYQLPGRCEHAAVRLSHDPKLFRLAPTVQEVAAMAPGEGVGDGSILSAREAAAVKAKAAGLTPASAAAGPAPAVAKAMEPMAPAPVAPAAATMASAVPTTTVMSDSAPAASPPSATLPVPDPTPAATQTAAAATPPAAAQPDPAPADDGKLVHMPSQGHLLPGFLRRKKSN